MRGRERLVGDTEHREVGLGIANGNRHEVWLSDQLEQRQQPLPLVNLFGNNGGVQVGLVKVQSLHLQTSHHILDQERGKRYGRASLVRVGAQRIPIAVVEEDA